MKNIFRYIFSFFLILSLLGLGESSIITVSNVKNNNQSEWVNKTIPTGKVSRCYQYNQFNYITDTNLNLHSWSNDYSIFFNRIVSVKLISQSIVFININYLIFLFLKLHIPRKSVEYLHISNIKTDSFTKFCLLSAIQHDVGNITWNQLLNRKWIKKLKYALAISIKLSVLQDGFGNGYI